MRDLLHSRREILRTSLGAACAALVPSRAPAGRSERCHFVLLGDLHFDRLEHHDRAWVAATHPDDLRQIDDYTRITRDLLPRLFDGLRAKVLDLSHAGGRTACVLQAGDFVEGLCGSRALAVRQDQEALAFVRAAALGAPFLFTKGNHDITGPGAAEAFAEVFQPYLSEQARALSPAASVARACRSVAAGPAQLVFYDAYDDDSLAWFEAQLARRTAAHLFVIVHPPVVPYGARSSWHLYSAPADARRRAKLLELLAVHEAFVLAGHIHKYSVIVRTVGRRRFVQLSTCSVVGTEEVAPRTCLSGVGAYNGDQIAVEPRFSPATAAERRAVLEAEQPFVRAFEYADLPGYAVLTVDPSHVSAEIHAGMQQAPWRTLDLTRLRSRPAEAAPGGGLRCG